MANECSREGLAVAPQSGVLHYALGLALVRLKQADAAAEAPAREPAGT
jgi:hypothetical protein